MKIRGITVTAIGSEKDPIETLLDRIVGRVAAEDVIDPRDGSVITACNEMISYEQGNKIVEAGIKAVQIRSVLTCRNETGVCVKCYGQDLAHGGYVNIGEAVGHRCRAGHRRTGHAADDAYLPYRRRCFRKGYHAGSSAR